MQVKPLTVANPSFALDFHARDWPPLQFLREFTVNSIEAIRERRDAGLAEGDQLVVWRTFTELEGRLPAPKLCCIDTGSGMTPEQLEKFINALASTSKVQALSGNFGMGAKVAGAEFSPEGMTYLSWTGAPEQGFTCTLRRDRASDEWGLVIDPSSGEFLSACDPELCPPEIRQAGWCGTVVVFHGRAPEQDTTQPPSDDLGPAWIQKAINCRFWELPEDIEIRCQRSDGRHLRRARGQRALVASHAQQSGMMPLSDARVHWSILREDEHEARRKQNGRWAATGHRAALYQGELYELRQHSSGGYRKLQEFGILFGHERVVLYIEPNHAETDTVRAHLTYPQGTETKELPWERWADEFIADMPQPLRDLVEKAAGRQATRDRRDMLRRMEEIAKQMPIPRYQPKPEGPERSGEATHGGSPGKGKAGEGGRNPVGEQRGSAQGGNVVSLFTRRGGVPAVQVADQHLPEIKPRWIEEGQREEGVLEDLGASFLARQSVLLLNAEFRGYRVLLDYYRERFAGRPGAEPIVLAEVRAACEDQAMEFIWGVLRLRCQPHWTQPAEEHALDDRCLTGCLMQHATLAARIEERLNRRLKKVAA